MQLFKNGFTYVSTFVVCNNSFYMFQVSNPKNLSIKHVDFTITNEIQPHEQVDKKMISEMLNEYKENL